MSKYSFPYKNAKRYHLQLHCRHPNKYGENLYMSSGRAAQEQAQGAVDSWYGLKVFFFFVRARLHDDIV